MARKIFKGFKQEIEGQFTAEVGYLYFVRKAANTGATDGYLLFNGKKYGTSVDAVAELEEKIGELPASAASISEWIQEIERTTASTIGTLSGRVDTIENDYLTSSDKTALENAIGTVSGRVDNLEASAHSHSNMEVLNGITAEKVAAWDAASAYTNTKYDSAVTASKVVLSALTNPSKGFQKSYEIFQGGASLGVIDIPKDMVVSSGEVTENQSQEKVLRLYIANTDPQQHVDILISDLAHVYTEGTGITIGNDDKISVKVVEANGLSVDSDGIKLAVATSAQTGAMTAADKEKLDSIAVSAQTNVIEGVQLNGADLTPDANKKVNVELPSAEVSGSSNGVEVTVNQVSGAVTTVTVVAPDFDNTYAAKTDVETLSGSVVSLEAVSAGTRLDTLEAISAGTRIAALEAISAKTDTALQEITEGDGSVVVGAKSNNAQSVAVKISAGSDNALSLAADGLFAAIYYDGDDSE